MATICNVRIFDGTAFRKESAVTFENGTITALDDRREGEDMGGVLLCPGFVDIHMHGQKGLDSMRPGDNGRMAETQVKYGVTSFCPASITETDEAIRAYLADIRAAMELERGARVLGAYLEGPYLAERVKGAHNAAKLRDPELTHYQELTAGFEDEIRRVTLAPEKPGAWSLCSTSRAGGWWPLSDIRSQRRRRHPGPWPWGSPALPIPATGWNRSTTENRASWG